MKTAFTQIGNGEKKLRNFAKGLGWASEKTSKIIPNKFLFLISFLYLCIVNHYQETITK